MFKSINFKYIDKPAQIQGQPKKYKHNSGRISTDEFLVTKQKKPIQYIYVGGNMECVAK